MSRSERAGARNAFSFFQKAHFSLEKNFMADMIYANIISFVKNIHTNKITFGIIVFRYLLH